jgi:hypothetical protein
MQAIPLCPITGLPAIRGIQPISGRLIRGLWRGAFGVATDRQLGGIDHFSLRESPCGLAFLDPMPEGDDAFYLDLYGRGDFHRVLGALRIARAEFRRIAELVRPGDKVLDVGCGKGALVPHLPHATYVGLDRIVMRTLPSSTSGAKRLRRMPHHILKNTTPSVPFIPSSTWQIRWTLPAIW